MNPPPSSRRPAGIPDKGNVKYAVAAVALIAATAGLFAMRRCSGPSEAVATVPLGPSGAVSTAPVNPKIEDIPLPPPPEEQKPASATGPRIVYTSAGGCDGKCAGSSPPELGQALQVRAGQARRCYNQALSQDSTLKGHVSINVRIGPAGNVCSATVASNDMGSPAVANCAANVFRTGSGYPSPRGGCVDANVPLNFKPQSQ